MKLALSFVVLAVVVSLIPEVILSIRKCVAAAVNLVRQILQPAKIIRIQRAWPDVIDDITSAVRSGAPLEQGFIEAAVRAPNEVRKLLQSAIAKLRTGSSLNQTLDYLLTTQIDAVGRRLVIALKIANSAGGKDVLTTLQLLAEAIRRDLQLLDQLRAKQRSAITGAKVAVFAPWLVIAVTSAQPSVRAAYTSAAGGLLLVVVAVVCGIAYLWMLQLAKLRIGSLQ